MPKEEFYTFLSDGVSFASRRAANLRTIYAPLCGSDASSLKSAITPSLSGDIKVDRYHYLTKPASREDLRHPLRDFFVHIKGRGVYSAAKESAPRSSTVEVGQLWHKVVRVHAKAGVELTTLNFIPSSNEPVELMRVSIKNISRQTLRLTPTAAIPIFGRSLANKHDHEHVTALLHRVRQNAVGVTVEPTMAFNEEGHRELKCVYFVYGKQAGGGALQGTFPTVDSFYGEGGNLDRPQAVFDSLPPRRLTEGALNGKEAVGALRFKDVTLRPGQSADYIIAVGTAASEKKAAAIFKQFSSPKSFDAALAVTQKFWEQKVNAIQIQTGDPRFNSWMRWVIVQPVLRRIFGCSFLPDHDYGKGGKGWRDLWQDLLSLLLIEPQPVRADLINNCAGIRIDGSNATIIGARPGEFIADRNTISRVWMDHGCWPLMTLLLYVHQTGDFDIFMQLQTYFRDPQLSRCLHKDPGWTAQYGGFLRDAKGRVYRGTILEHVLVEHLTQFFNVGEHNIIRLESADWNDGLDMAFERGESVAFSAFYAGNLLKLADFLEELGRRKNLAKVRLAKELMALLDTLKSKPIMYNDWQVKRKMFNAYCDAVQPAVSGAQVDVPISAVVADLRAKGQWMFKHILSQEKISVGRKSRGRLKNFTWFNGYYDNQGKQVDRGTDAGSGGQVRMGLTAQVFATMSGLATSEDIGQVHRSVEAFLRDKKLGGYRLNTDFRLKHYLDLGRAFGFAYGTKENGSFFSHMNVMYAYALLSRGFVREGAGVLESIYRMAISGKSKIYPGIPEYFDAEGRGMYHYLTGSASWLVLTALTQVFGCRGQWGDLVLNPKLTKHQFDRRGVATVKFHFAGHPVTVEYVNPKHLEAGSYAIKQATQNGWPMSFTRLSAPASLLIPRHYIQRPTQIKVLLDGL